ncbi:MAG: osmoprotectant NAGGN system M42 family peptidase [Bacteroidetes bacterium]|nr:osmoprotectant NAGGN system M42 family peptidase [Bacteroidota bacterium]
MKTIDVDQDYLLATLRALIAIPSPSGYTDNIVHFTCGELEKLGLPFELTRRGAIRADIKGQMEKPDRALVAHLDTLGAMVRELKPNGHVAITPIGTWSSRFAEGARVTIIKDHGMERGTILPLLASGHAYGDDVDRQPVNWDQVEVRIDNTTPDKESLDKLGVQVGDYISIDPCFEMTETGFINSRHLDDKAGVATLLATAKALRDAKAEIPVDCHLLFTISEEIGSGASAILHRDIAEMVTVDNATVAEVQNSSVDGVTICMLDSAGPFDYHLTHKLLQLCRENDIVHRRDIFRYYKSDSASAIDAGNDLRTSLVCFGLEGSHGYERVHIRSLIALARLLGAYVRSEPTFRRDKFELGSINGFPHQQEDGSGS